MKKKLGLIFISLLLVQVLLVGVASAAYNPLGNLKLKITLLPKVITPSNALGDLTFNLQEGIHDLLTNSTGIEIDHSYIFVELNDATILAVDPPRAMY